VSGRFDASLVKSSSNRSKRNWQLRSDSSLELALAPRQPGEWRLAELRIGISCQFWRSILRTLLNCLTQGMRCVGSETDLIENKDNLEQIELGWIAMRLMSRRSSHFLISGIN
jgi:hypothetical protein